MPAGMLMIYRYNDPSYYGGIERKMLFIAEDLHRRGLFRPMLLTNYDRSMFAKDFAALGLDVHRCDMSGPRGLWRTATVAGRLVDRHGVTLLQTHRFWTSLAGALVRRRRTDLKHIHRVHTHIAFSEIPAWRQGLYHRLDDFAQRYVDRYVVLHEGLARELRELSRIAPEKITVVYNGIPPLGPPPPATELAAPLDRSIVIVGELEPRKRQEHAIRAVAFLRREHDLDLRLILAGGDSFGYEAFLRELAAAEGVTDLVEFAGYVSDVASLMAGKGVVAMTSDFEGIPTSIIEAMSIGRLVMATDVGGTADLIDDGVNGFLLPPGEWSVFAERLLQVYAGEPGAWASMRQAAVDTYTQRFTVPAMMAGLCEVYAELGLV